jgi:hypothetical protein
MTGTERDDTRNAKFVLAVCRSWPDAGNTIITLYSRTPATPRKTCHLPEPIATANNPAASRNTIVKSIADVIFRKCCGSINTPSKHAKQQAY